MIYNYNRNYHSNFSILNINTLNDNIDIIILTRQLCLSDTLIEYFIDNILKKNNYIILISSFKIDETLLKDNISIMEEFPLKILLNLIEQDEEALNDIYLFDKTILKYKDTFTFLNKVILHDEDVDDYNLDNKLIFSNESIEIDNYIDKDSSILIYLSKERRNNQDNIIKLLNKLDFNNKILISDVESMIFLENDKILLFPLKYILKLYDYFEKKSIILFLDSYNLHELIWKDFKKIFIINEKLEYNLNIKKLELLETIYKCDIVIDCVNTNKNLLFDLNKEIYSIDNFIKKREYLINVESILVVVEIDICTSLHNLNFFFENLFIILSDYKFELYIILLDNIENENKNYIEQLSLINKEIKLIYNNEDISIEYLMKKYLQDVSYKYILFLKTSYIIDNISLKEKIRIIEKDNEIEYVESFIINNYENIFNINKELDKIEFCKIKDFLPRYMDKDNDKYNIYGSLMTRKEYLNIINISNIKNKKVISINSLLDVGCNKSSIKFEKNKYRNYKEKDKIYEYLFFNNIKVNSLPEIENLIEINLKLYYYLKNDKIVEIDKIELLKDIYINGIEDGIIYSKKQLINILDNEGIHKYKNKLYLKKNNINLELGLIKKKIQDMNINEHLNNIKIFCSNFKESTDMKIVVNIYIGDIEIGKYILSKLQKSYLCDYPFILTVKNQEYVDEILKEFKLKKYIIFLCKEYGSDIISFLQSMYVIKQKYNIEYIYKIHTKSKRNWLDSCLNFLIENDINYLKENLYKNDSNCLGSIKYYSIKSVNGDSGKLIEKYNNELDKTVFIGGTIFFCEIKLIERIFRFLKYRNYKMYFLNNMYDTGGIHFRKSPAHFLERIFGLITLDKEKEYNNLLQCSKVKNNLFDYKFNLGGSIIFVLVEFEENENIRIVIDKLINLYDNYEIGMSIVYNNKNADFIENLFEDCNNLILINVGDNENKIYSSKFIELDIWNKFESWNKICMFDKNTLFLKKLSKKYMDSNIIINNKEEKSGILMLLNIKNIINLIKKEKFNGEINDNSIKQWFCENLIGVEKEKIPINTDLDDIDKSILIHRIFDKVENDEKWNYIINWLIRYLQE